MLRNYIKIAFRNLRRHKIYSYINIGGLAIGITCCLLILLYIHDELTYDSFHENAKRIYRINIDIKFGATESTAPLSSDMMGPTLKKDYPYVEEYTRIYSFVSNKKIKKDNEFNNEHSVAYVDSTFFKVFTFPVISGQADNLLNEPNTVVITETIAKKYFGTADAAGKFIETGEKGNKNYKVTAVIEDMPGNSHFKFNFLFPMLNLHYNAWGNYLSSNFHTYLVLKEGTDYKEFEQNLKQYADNYVFPYAKGILNVKTKEEFEKTGNWIKFSLIPLTDIHLYSTQSFELSPSGTIQYVYIFSAVAFFILLIACVNFMNLTTAQSSNRAKEVGIRKVLGTERKNLIVQFLSESAFMSFLSVCLAVFIVYNILPLFNSLSGKEITNSSLESGGFVLVLILLILFIGVLSASYPSIYMSRFRPIEIIKGKLLLGTKSGGLRNILVVFQFTASIVLITATIIVYNQLDFIQNKDLGYNKEQVLVINDFYNLRKNGDAFKEEMLKLPGVSSGTISGFLPVPSNRVFNVFSKDALGVSEKGLVMQDWAVDYEYLNTLDIKLLEGRNFSREYGTDSSAIILNEKAVMQRGYDNPIGKKIYKPGFDGQITGYTIIGVIKDFHFESLRQEIGPLSLVLGKNPASVSFRINTADVQSILKTAETNWKSMTAGMPFKYSFMDESFNEVYLVEQRVGKIVFSFSALAIIIACLGLFGLTGFLAEQKTKEIGVRKVLGASVKSILLMLSKESVKWIVISNIIAWPVAYYSMNKWLQDFAYRIEISFWVFVLAGITALLIALAIVSFQTVKAATANPVESLKYE